MNDHNHEKFKDTKKCLIGRNLPFKLDGNHGNGSQTFKDVSKRPVKLSFKLEMKVRLVVIDDEPFCWEDVCNN